MRIAVRLKKFQLGVGLHLSNPFKKASYGYTHEQYDGDWWSFGIGIISFWASNNVHTFLTKEEIAANILKFHQTKVIKAIDEFITKTQDISKITGKNELAAPEEYVKMIKALNEYYRVK
jgi:hypothetical protein